MVASGAVNDFFKEYMQNLDEQITLSFGGKVGKKESESDEAIGCAWCGEVFEDDEQFGKHLHFIRRGGGNLACIMRRHEASQARLDPVIERLSTAARLTEEA